MKNFVLLVISMSFCFYGLGNAQTDFSTEAFYQFMEANKDLEPEVLINRHAPSVPYYSQINNDSPLDNAAYLDSIDLQYDLTVAEMELLKKNNFIISERMNFPIYPGGLGGPPQSNSFLWAYDHIFECELPVFVSTDAILYALHCSYLNILTRLELEILAPKLRRCVTNLYNLFPTLLKKYQANPTLHQALKDVDLYVTTAHCQMQRKVYQPHFASSADVDAVLQAIKDEQFISLPLFTDINRPIDFSQFKLRGYYAEEEELWGYFKCMMWLGRVDFILGNAPREWYEAGFTKEGLRRMNLAAALLNELLELADVQTTFAEIDETLQILVGESDNMTPGDLYDFIHSQNVTVDDLLDDTKFDLYLEGLASTQEYGQKILSSIVKGNKWTTEPTPLPVSYKLMGQRFLIDSYVFYKVVFDNVVYQEQKVCRMMPDPLDAMFALGNDDALPLLREQLESGKHSSQLASLRYLIDSYDETFWNNSFYNTWLQSIRTLGTNDFENPPLFMQTTAWHQQKLNTQLASWAQLRHDNLLYVKQSYTHGGDCFFPHSYIEPYPAFYRQIGKFAEIAESFSVFEDVSDSWSGRRLIEYFTRLKEIMTMLESIAQKELDRTPFSIEEIDFLQQMLFIEKSSGSVNADGWYVDLHFGCDGSEAGFNVADVHTQPTKCNDPNPIGRILHVGTGKINLGVFIADSPSNDFRPMAYIGPVMSYYEKITEDFNRLTDEEWAEQVQAESLPARPDWVNSYLIGKDGNMMAPGRELEGVLYTKAAKNLNKNPESFSLLQNYPNPFNPTTTIQYEVSKQSHVRLAIYDVLGREVKTLLNRISQPGTFEMAWGGTDDYQNPVAGGVYFCRMEAGDPSTSSGRRFVKTIKLALVR
jgi:hypothetical protein